MLVLSRKEDEAVTIVCHQPGVVKITLVRGDHGKARLGFDGPPTTNFIRDELLASCPLGPDGLPTMQRGQS